MRACMLSISGERGPARALEIDAAITTVVSQMKRLMAMTSLPE
jgi:hypothetical protein